jgi:two-component system invasion response regulator UvrY
MRAVDGVKTIILRREKNMIRVMLVDDHDLVRLLMKERLERVAGIEIIAQATTGEEAISKAKEARPDVVLLDVNMPGIGGVETVRVLRRIDDSMKLVIVSVHSDGPFPMRLLEMGVDGYLTKSSAPHELVAAVRMVHQGQRYVDPKLAQSVVLGNLGTNTSPVDTLSARELEVFSLIVKGQRISDIAERLCRSPKTISTLRGRICRKLSVSSDVELTLVALSYGLVEPFAFGPQDAFSF